MKIHYYPGCTLKEKTTALDISTREAMKRLDVELVEPEGWSCCGAEYPLTEEKIVGLAAPIRVLRQVRDEGGDVLVTTCSFCFAVLKRANKAIRDDPLKHKRINAFLKDDIKIDPLTKEQNDGLRGLQRRGQGPPSPGVPPRPGRLPQDPGPPQTRPQGPGHRSLLRLPAAPAPEGDGGRRSRRPPHLRGVPRGRRLRGRRLSLQAGMLRVLSLRLPARRGHGGLLPGPPLGPDERRPGRGRDLPALLLQPGPPPGRHQGGLPGFPRNPGRVLHPAPGLGAGGGEDGSRPRGAPRPRRRRYSARSARPR